MRVVEEQMLKAIKSKKNFCSGNTQVVVSGNVAKVYLHCNLICIHNYADDTRKYSNGGWYSNTTKSRLNALDANITQRKGKWYFGDNSIFKNQI